MNLLELHCFLQDAEDHAIIRSSTNAPRKQGLNILEFLPGRQKAFSRRYDSNKRKRGTERICARSVKIRA